MAEYAGEWRNGKREGSGTLRYVDGARIDVEWIAGEPNGVGTYTAPNGREFSGRWSGWRLNGRSINALNEEAERTVYVPPHRRK